MTRIDRTWDNGTESALHALVDESLGMPAHHADLCSSCQRGGNENGNGNGGIRRYLPRKTIFEELADDELQAIVQEINDTRWNSLATKHPTRWQEEITRPSSQPTNTTRSIALTN